MAVHDRANSFAVDILEDIAMFIVGYSMTGA
jgi:hypothetical protein